MPTQCKQQLSSTLRRPGFSLVELLIVLSIIAILAALLFPVFSAARAKARETVCVSNLAQIGHAVALYVQDYDEYYPYAIHKWWRQHPDPLLGMPGIAPRVPQIPLIQDVLQPYCRSYELFHCPADYGSFPALSKPVLPSMYTAYGSSYNFVPLLERETVGCFSRPSELSYAFDYNGEWHSWRGADYWHLRESTLYYDGHAKSILSQDTHWGSNCN